MYMYVYLRYRSCSTSSYVYYKHGGICCFVGKGKEGEDRRNPTNPDDKGYGKGWIEGSGVCVTGLPRHEGSSLP